MMRDRKIGFMPQESSATYGGNRLLGAWYERLRKIVLRSPEPATRAFRFMSRLIEQEFVRSDGGVCLAFASPEADSASAKALLMLAYCLRSELDSRVLIVDARLTNQRVGISGQLGLAHSQGFAEILREGFDGRESLIHATPVSGVDVLPAGDVTGEGKTPMNRVRLVQLIDAARVRYSYVLLQVGSPLRDTRNVMIATESDAVFLLAEENLTFMKTLDDCRNVLLKNGVKDVRVVVTGAKP